MFKKLIEKNFAFIFIASIVVALLIPGSAKGLSFLLEGILMVMLYFAFLKVDFSEVAVYIKKPLLILYLAFGYLVLIPIIIFFIFSYLGQELAIAFLLLAALPPGVASPAFVGIIRGNTALSLALTTVCHLIAPFTMIALFYVLTSQVIDLDLTSIFYSLVVFIAIPLTPAQISKKLLKDKLVKKLGDYSSVVTILFLPVIIYIIVGDQAEKILSAPNLVFRNLGLLFLVFGFFHFAGYVLPFWKNRRDKITSSTSKAYMNTTLGIVLAYKFFTPEIALILVLAEIPWLLMFIPFKYFVEWMQRKK